jgi:hypothetical protein
VAILRLARSDAPSPQQNLEYELPDIAVLADTGRQVLLRSLAGKAVVVEFVNPQIGDQIDAVSTLLTAFEPSEIQFLLITEKSHELRRLLPFIPDEAIVVQQNYAELKKAFGVPDCCERRFVFDRSGKLVFRDYYYQADLRPRLNMLIDKTLPPASLAIREVLGSLHAGPFAELRERTRHTQPTKAIVIFFTSVSSTCPSGELIRALALRPNFNDAEVLLLLPREYTAADVETFKTNFNVHFAIQKFDTDLGEKWTSLMAVYGEAKLNGSIAFINKGEVSVLNDLSQLDKELSSL